LWETPDKIVLSDLVEDAVESSHLTHLGTEESVKEYLRDKIPTVLNKILRFAT